MGPKTSSLAAIVNCGGVLKNKPFDLLFKFCFFEQRGGRRDACEESRSGQIKRSAVFYLPVIMLLTEKLSLPPLPVMRTPAESI
jgi:hypothetical protein